MSARLRVLRPRTRAYGWRFVRLVREGQRPLPKYRLRRPVGSDTVADLYAGLEHLAPVAGWAAASFDVSTSRPDERTDD